MKLLKFVYEKTTGKNAPYYFEYSALTIIVKPVRKFVAQVLAPNCPFNNIRILLYRICGFKIGKHTFIGMKCYLDDMCYDLIKIGNNVTISYGVYFSCHGRRQGHLPIVIEDGAYIGMRASVISKPANDKLDGGGYHYCAKYSGWSLCTYKQGYSQRSYGSRYSLQNHSQRGHLRNEVSAA